MDINELLEKNKISKYKLSKDSGIPYATLSDICLGKTDLKKCSAETVFKLAKALHTTVEKLLTPPKEVRIPFDLFKSNVCHKLKRQGDMDFLLDELKRDDISKYYKKKWYPEAFYTLAMVDYISRVNNVPFCDKYSKLRTARLKETVYPASVVALSRLTNSDKPKQDAIKESIPEFIRFNIVESEIRDVQ